MDRSARVKSRILLVEHESSLVTMLRDNLEKQGFLIEQAADGGEALARFEERKPDLVLLDWMLPQMPGIEVCRQLRRRASHELPIIIMSASSDNRDEVHALNEGADDYVAKPIGMDGLLARMRALLRRAGTQSANGGQLTFHDLTLDIASHRVRRNGRALHLSPAEFQLLRFLLDHPRHVFSREELRDALWGSDTSVMLRGLDVLIRRLRRAIEFPGERSFVRTVRGVGYALDMAPAA